MAVRLICRSGANTIETGGWELVALRVDLGDAEPKQEPDDDPTEPDDDWDIESIAHEGEEEDS